MSNNTFEKIKIFFITAFTALTSWLGILAIPIYVLVILSITDYITGVAVAPRRKQAVDSTKGLNGIAKKVCILLLVGVGAVVDWLILYATNNIGVDYKFKFIIASLVAVWLICNEIISILENIADMGVKLPPFLMKIVAKLKTTVEQRGDKSDD